MFGRKIALALHDHDVLYPGLLLGRLQVEDEAQLLHLGAVRAVPAGRGVLPARVPLEELGLAGQDSQIHQVSKMSN